MPRTHLVLAFYAMTALPATYNTLTEYQQLHGFRTRALYLNDAERPMGARFTHVKTGFTLDLLEIQSVPQAFLWVTTPPTSNMGEPHTQEHLLLSKGRLGRDLQLHETMSLIGATAFTSQYRTCYPFHTVAGPSAFFAHFERQLHAMLAPDYSDEEILREVRNFGVTVDGAGKPLRLEEKGSIYNEMVSSMTQGSRLAFYERQRLVYGPEHPLSFVSGGAPDAIRQMQASHIRSFHRDTHHLANMGAIVSFASNLPFDEALRLFDETVTRMQGNKPVRPPAPKFSPAQPAQAGTTRLVDYPHQDPQQAGQLSFTWPAVYGLAASDEVLFQMFLSNFAGGPTTNLYKRFIDSRARKMDLGARSVGGFLSDDLGLVASVSFPDANPVNATEARLSEVREQILDELRLIAGWPAGSPALAEFNSRMRSRLIEYRRSMSKFVSEPPRFGFRNASSSWLDQLAYLDRRGGFRRSLTLRPELTGIDTLLSAPGTMWAAAIGRWKLLEVAPYAIAARPSPELVSRDTRERDERAAAEVERLKSVYKTVDAQQAIRLYQADYDKRTTELERLDAETKMPPFTDSPPMTADDTLDYRVTKTAGVTAVHSRFPGMTSATAGLALRASSVPADQLVYLAAIPALLTSTGVIRDGKAIGYDEMSEALKNEILSLEASFSTNPKTGRVEIVVRGAGNDLAESLRALEWMRLALYHPNWRPENLPRLRDIVDRQLNSLRTTMQRGEEQWVRDPSTAWWRQDPLQLTAASFLTRAHHFHRLRWLFKDPAPACAEFFDQAAAIVDGSTPRAQLGAKAAELAGRATGPCRLVALEAAKDLEALLSDIPDSALTADWSYLCRQMRDDLAVPPAQALEKLEAVRLSLMRKTGARMFLISSPENEPKLVEAAAPLLAGLSAGRAAAPSFVPIVHIRSRYLAREKDARAPRFVALAAPNMRGGVMMNMAPLIGYEDVDRESLLRYLAGSTYSGGGAHALFMKTWAAGLAYSNGPGPVLSMGTFQYYAERTPELPQTLRFVIEEVKRAPRNVDLVDYALTRTFQSNSAQTFEIRGEAIATNLADGVAPEKVRRFRQALLDLRKQPRLMAEIYRRVDDVYASVFPGYAPGAQTPERTNYFVIGPEKQLSLYEEYLKSAVGAEERLHRLYPRDFWITRD